MNRNGAMNPEMKKSQQAAPSCSNEDSSTNAPDLWLCIFLSFVFAGLLAANAIGDYMGFKALTVWLAFCILGFTFAIRTRPLFASRCSRNPAWCLLLAWLFLNVGVDVAYFGQGLGAKGITGLLIQWVPMAVFLIVLPIVFGKRFIIPTLLTIALGCAWFAWMNIAAAMIGLSDALVEAREVLYESRYIEGTYRWQSPLISTSPLSGMLRFAAPIIIYAIWSHRAFKRWAFGIIFVVALIGALIALVRVEYRNGFIPLAGMLAWLSLSKETTRRLAAFAFVLYGLLAPLLWTNDAFLRFTEEGLPDFVLKILGRQDFSQVTVLSGRVDVWKDGIESILHGTHLLTGTGQAALNSADYSAAAEALLMSNNPNVIARIDFHQGFLDLMFIYGALPTTAFALWILVKMSRRIRVDAGSEAGSRTDTSLALLCMGLVWLSNAHDGYFSGSNLFCALICYAMMELVRPQRITNQIGKRGYSLASRSAPKSTEQYIRGTWLAERF